MSDRASDGPPPGVNGSPSTVSSINFVITAIYTVTFANAIFRVVHVDDMKVSIALRDDAHGPAQLCAAISMIMALRYFFGNNNFMDEVFSSPEGPWQRLYHFVVITTQSLILLGSSYLVTNGEVFVRWLFALFALEIMWFFGCLAFSRRSISGPSGRLSRRLVCNELSNATVAVVALVGMLTLAQHEGVLIWVVFAAFFVNTVIDVRLNLRSYMGV